MNIYDEVFKKISFGVIFNTKKFSKDAEIFGIIKNQDLNEIGTMDNKRNKRKNSKMEENGEIILEDDKSICERMGIQTFGNNIPNLFTSFDNQNDKIPEYLTNAIRDSNYSSPTPVQMAAISVLLKRRHALICAPTGSGKTFAYLYPILCSIGVDKCQGLKALIILPTKELANQIFNEIVMLTRFSKIRSLKLSKIGTKVKDYNKYNIIIATPQRLVELMESNKKINLSKIDWLILDEGDLLLHDSAKSFKDQIATIYNSCKSTTTRCIFSATINTQIEDWVQLYLDDPVTVLIGSKNSPPEAIHQELIFVGQESGKIIAIRNIFKRSLDPPVLIFVNSIEKAKELFTELMYDGINVAAMHSEKTESQRINLVNSFRTGKIWVLITTDLMSRGIDFKGIKTVFNYDVPHSPISYIHRIGRTGRAGVPGSAITFYTENDIQQIKTLIPVLKRSKAKYPEYLDSL